MFVSSTCYDLAQVRADLSAFIEGYGFTPMLSETSSFPINPDSTTVENCRRAVHEHADILVLIVGGRYGALDAVDKDTIGGVGFRAGPSRLQDCA